MKSGLSRKFLAPSLILIAIGLVTTLLVTYFSTRQAALKESGQRLHRETTLAAHLIDNWLQARMIDLHLWAQEEVLVELIDKQGLIVDHTEKAKRFLATQQTGHPFLEGIFVADSAGKVLAFSTMAAQPLAQIRLVDRLYFQETLSDRQIVSPLVLSKLSGKRVFVVTAPIKVGEEIKGIIGGVIDFSAFIDLFFNNDHHQENEIALLSDAGGLVLATSRPQMQTLPEPLARTLATVTPSVEMQSINISDYLLSVRSLQHTGWVFAIARSMDAVVQPLHSAGQISGLLAIVVLLIISLNIFSLFHRQISHRLQAMIRIINQVKQGDLSCRIPLPPGSEDEVSDLAITFNRMIEHLETNIALLHREIQMRKDSEHMLSYHQDNLEMIIAERSRELEKEIIERHQIEERLARTKQLEMIGTLAGGVAHDLNNILSGIVSYPDLLLLQLAPDSPLAGPLRSIKRTGEKAAAIVQDLLTLSGHRCLSNKMVCLNDLVWAFLQGQDSRDLLAQHPQIAVSCDCCAQLPPIEGAHTPLAKVLVHLVTQAAMMMGPAGGQIVLRTAQQVLAIPVQAYEQIASGSYCLLEMEYFGKGVAPEHLARIFEPFYTSKKLGLQGTGLEMAAVLATVKVHRGFIDCSSAIESGCRFSLYFPAAVSPSSISGKQAAEENDRPCSHSGASGTMTQ